MNDDVIGGRLRERIRRDFPDAETAEYVPLELRFLAADPERSRQNPNGEWPSVLDRATGSPEL
ncbi:hypothetical protein [Streptomyces jumonjinensis]|uniref:hypothetical protein n=1 Tax=Streptomyces jumonjinensis TaxID=1945 RepID=UPI0037A966C9